MICKPSSGGRRRQVSSCRVVLGSFFRAMGTSAMGVRAASGHSICSQEALCRRHSCARAVIYFMPRPPHWRLSGSPMHRTTRLRLGCTTNSLVFAEAIRWHLKDHNCKQIVVAISFDSGYASFLDDVLPDDASRQRITVLEGPPSHRDIAAHRLRTVNLNEDVLRADKLEVLSYQNQNQGYIDRRLSNAPMTITPPATIAGMSPLPPPPALPSTTPATTNGGGQILPPSSYATAIKAASPPPQVTLPIPIKTKTSKTPARQATKTPQWNPGARGLDSPLEVHQPSLDNIKKRKDNSKLCNNHYLRGPCAKGDACCFEHNYRASEQEKVAIAFLARQNPCTSGQDCDVKDCIYGHHVSVPECQCCWTWPLSSFENVPSMRCFCRGLAWPFACSHEAQLWHVGVKTLACDHADLLLCSAPAQTTDNAPILTASSGPRSTLRIQSLGRLISISTRYSLPWSLHVQSPLKVGNSRLLGFCAAHYVSHCGSGQWLEFFFLDKFLWMLPS